MWILDFLPDSFFYLLIILGIGGIIAGFFLGSFPIINRYKLPIQIVSVILTILGVWYAGGIAKDQEYRKKVEAAEARARLAEEKAATATARVEYVFQDRVKVVKETQVVIQERIRDISVKIDEQCRVLPEVVDIHNQAAKRIKK